MLSLHHGKSLNRKALLREIFLSSSIRQKNRLSPSHCGAGIAIFIPDEEKRVRPGKQIAKEGPNVTQTGNSLPETKPETNVDVSNFTGRVLWDDVIKIDLDE